MDPLWMPSQKLKKESNIQRFINFINEEHGLTLDSYFDLYDWSIKNIPEFWYSIWKFTDIKASKAPKEVVDNLNKFPGVNWFPGAELNFAENLLHHKDEHLAFIFKGETKKYRKLTYKELYNTVIRLAHSLKRLDIEPGDRICGYMPNIIETPIAMLASTSIGATWASCGAELGSQTVIDRLNQINPKILFASDGYLYKGKFFNSLDKIKETIKGIPSLEKIIICPYVKEEPDISDIPNSILLSDFVGNKKVNESEFEFEQLPFNHPLYIMFSSGTTGKPKCMVQSAGGVLINHLKELIPHTDLKRNDIIMYITSPSWMMWNWLISSLAVGATIVLYDGNPNYPDPNAMWQLIQDEHITIFGCSATYINYLRRQKISPRENFDLSSLREISQTGSALSSEGFEYVYQEIKKDLHFNSISGGTDINGCFAAGCPILPVYAGQIQAPALAMKIKAYDDNANPLLDQQGELVCEAPSPSMPLYFWNDPNNERYINAYFNFYTNQNVWRHGDYITIHNDTGGITFFGRSDAILKPSGVRIGTAEIYNIVEELDEVEDSLVIGQKWKDDQRILLFVKLAPNYKLTDDFKDKISKLLKEKGSPRHVPALILEVPDIPYTFSGKKVEIAVNKIIHGNSILNKGALSNPESLDYFQKLIPKLQK